MDAEKFPRVPEDLLESLEALYPERPVMPGQGLDELMHYGGQRTLIKWLRSVYTAQNTPDEEVPEEERDQDVLE